ncbi:MAG: uroporphyrinogen decarboxylase [Hyphomicrobiales bacterium]
MNTSNPAPVKKLLAVLNGKRFYRPPICIMRQSGRYLPEYREVRTKAKNFIEFCYSPDLATEVTLQPIRRFGFDAAILFSDILVVPDALGLPVQFVENEGPKLQPLDPGRNFSELHSEVDLDRLSPVFEAIRRIKSSLPQETTFLGFCGAPWTVASYMIAGKGTPELAPSRVLAYRNPVYVQQLIDRLVDASIAYLIKQAEAGVDAIQIFESFAGALTGLDIGKFSIDPIARIIKGVRKKYPDMKFIVFGRGSGGNHVRYAQETGANAVGLDWGVDPKWAAKTVQPLLPVQGNLDPLAVVAGGESLDRHTDAILEAFSGGGHIFNFGHGIVPETPIENVERVLKRIRG